MFAAWCKEECIDEAIVAVMTQDLVRRSGALTQSIGKGRALMTSARLGSRDRQVVRFARLVMTPAWPASVQRDEKELKSRPAPFKGETKLMALYCSGRCIAATLAPIAICSCRSSFRTER